MNALPSLPVLLAGALLAGCTAPPSAPHAAPWQWVGRDGRVVIYRGVNLNNHAKLRPDYHHGLTDAELALLPEQGITLVRLLVFWEALEPEQGAWDADYVAQVNADVAQLASLGLDIVLDLHQDVWGVGFGFTGFPRWTCSEEVYAAFVPNPTSWSLNYANPNVAGCFDAFWHSADLQESYADMAARLVSEVDAPNVVGLDVMNEPYWGTATAQEHDEVLLPAFYERVVQAVRAVDPWIRLFLEPSVATNLTTDPQLDLSPIHDPYLGFAPHFYPAYAESGSGFDGDFTGEAQGLGRLAAYAEDRRVPWMLGEFGIFSDQGNEDVYIHDVLDAVQTDGGSAAYWSYDRRYGVLQDDGTPGPLLPALGAPYVHRVPGRLLSVDGTTVHLRLEGEGTVQWVAEGCSVTADGAEILQVREDPMRIGARIEAHGEATVGLRCPER